MLDDDEIIEKLSETVFDVHEYIQKESLSAVDDLKEIEKIVNEIEENSKKLHEIFVSLIYLNELLIIFGEEPQVSKKKAKKILKTKVFINIFDLLEGKYEKRTTKKLLIQDMIDNPERIFPLKFAKGGAFQSFLQNIREEI